MPTKKSDKSKSKSKKAGKGEGGGKGKKKGSKKKVKAKLSEDAKSRQLEQRAAVEEERRRLREELVNSFLRHKLQKEQHLTRLNQCKLIEKWRHILREAKSQELGKELEMMKLDFDKRFSENSLEIGRLMEALFQSGVDFVQQSEGHKRGTQETFNEHISRLKVLESLYEQERSLLEYTIAGDYDKAKDCHRNQEAVLLENLTSLQTHYRQSFLDQQSHFQIRKDEIINQGLEEVQTIRQMLERRLERKWQQLHESCVESGELDEQRWNLYIQLERKDRLAFEQQKEVANRLEQLSSMVSRMQIQQEQISSGNHPEASLIEERNELHERRERWRLRLLRQQSRHIERLKAVAASSSDAAEHLEQLARQGILILRSAQRCQLLKPETRMKTMSSRRFSIEYPDESEANEPFRHFWTRFNNACLDTVLLQRHQAFMNRSKTAQLTLLREERALPSQLKGTTLTIHPAEK